MNAFPMLDIGEINELGLRVSQTSICPTYAELAKQIRFEGYESFNGKRPRAAYLVALY